jgi:hypothetical protein
VSTRKLVNDFDLPVCVGLESYVVFCNIVSTVAKLVSSKLRPTRLSAAEDVRGIRFEPFRIIQYWPLILSLITCFFSKTLVISNNDRTV